MKLIKTFYSLGVVAVCIVGLFVIMNYETIKEGRRNGRTQRRWLYYGTRLNRGDD